MALTSRSEHRHRILQTLSAQPAARAERSRVLSDMGSRFGELWSNEDLESPRTRPFEKKWENRASFERAEMVRDGLLSERADGVWELTKTGQSAAEALQDLPRNWRLSEIARREKLWTLLQEQGGPTNVPASAYRGLIYDGYRGVYVDKKTTKSSVTPDGAALTFMHLGTAYADELTEAGVTYHYPDTGTPGRDAAEIRATRASFEAGLPVFVVTHGSLGSRSRTVQRAFVEEINDTERVALITFIGMGELPPPPALTMSTTPFQLTDLDSSWVWTKRKSRPNQNRFAFLVEKTYGRACAVCEVRISAVIQAAHLRPKSTMGSDDERNGLPLCANHHLLHDQFHWSIDPETLGIVASAEYENLQSLGITRRDISHLPALPHLEALNDAWSRWRSKQPKKQRATGSASS